APRGRRIERTSLLRSRRKPRKSPLSAYAPIFPSPKLPTSSAPANFPKLGGAIAMPRGALRLPRLAIRCTVLAEVGELVYEPEVVTGNFLLAVGVFSRRSRNPRRPR